MGNKGLNPSFRLKYVVPMAVNIMEKSLVNCKFPGKSNKLPWDIRMKCKMRIYKCNKEMYPAIQTCGLCEHRQYHRIGYRLAVSRGLDVKFI
jgi:hypothetical protein